MPGVNINSTNLLIAFSVPSVIVPNTFTWAAAITNASTSVIGFVPANTATTGTFVVAWDGSPGSWQALAGTGTTFETEARVIAAQAVPEPSTFVLFAAGLVGTVVLKRFLRVRTLDQGSLRSTARAGSVAT